MKMKRFEVLEQESEILRTIAEQYAPESKEYLALKHAGYALAFALTENSEKFAAFISALQEDLNDEQKAHLKSLGLDSRSG